MKNKFLICNMRIVNLGRPQFSHHRVRHMVEDIINEGVESLLEAIIRQ